MRYDRDWAAQRININTWQRSTRTSERHRGRWRGWACQIELDCQHAGPCDTKNREEDVESFSSYGLRDCGALALTRLSLDKLWTVDLPEDNAAGPLAMDPGPCRSGVRRASGTCPPSRRGLLAMDPGPVYSDAARAPFREDPPRVHAFCSEVLGDCSSFRSLHAANPPFWKAARSSLHKLN
ncbi:hypothetical protein AAFF_G00268640 [Aldrovandia affinis]|uniref:Uncharacterized protein n=1 Tax=Aldrovandia affinis TaxID=143900 RepID=A0AAD7WSX5_9TELE|nr:hypothetical protein AAFF_G00268640 [Aldrovandia affinis]